MVFQQQQLLHSVIYFMQDSLKPEDQVQIHLLKVKKKQH
jgi:hypothetical protein